MYSNPIQGNDISRKGNFLLGDLGQTENQKILLKYHPKTVLGSATPKKLMK